MREIYFDNGATTRVFPEVREIMDELLEISYGNPSSMHRKGFEAEQYKNQARDVIAKSLKVDPKEIFFTSGGTESNNLALIGTALAGRRRRRHIITSCIEHASVYNTLSFLEDEGFEVTYLPVDDKGIVDLEALKEALRPDTLLVSVMAVNNEIGAVEPVEEIGKIIKKYDPEILFHTDCIQAYGKMPVRPKKWKADMISVSGHKIHGPKGIGFIYIKTGTKIKPLIWGGNQQKGMRSGTENMPGIAGLGKACELICQAQEEKIARISGIKKHFLERVLTEVPDTFDHSGEAPHIASVTFLGVRSEVLLHALEEKGIYVSAGSACSSNKPEVSGTLKGIGLEKDQYESTLRFSFSIYNSEEEVDFCIDALKELLVVLRRFKRR
jgi:cysteine desulfurase